MAGRGKKLNQTKNDRAARDFAEGKRVGRPKQEWVWAQDMQSGYWKKVGK